MTEIASGEKIYAAHHLGWGLRNIVRNGGFDENTYNSTALPSGWNAEGTATFVSDTDVHADAGGFDKETPRSIKITAVGATNEGINQTLKNLKAATTYHFWCRVKVTAGDTATVVTTGATTNLALTSTSDSWATLEGAFVTDSSGTDVVLKLYATADGDIVWFDDVIVVEGAAGPRPFVPNLLDGLLKIITTDDYGDQYQNAGWVAEIIGVNEVGNPTTITFQESYNNAPYIVATCAYVADSFFAVVETIGATTAKIQVYDETGADADCIVICLVIGPEESV
jgi:hypothetical protein